MASDDWCRAWAVGCDIDWTAWGVVVTLLGAIAVFMLGRAANAIADAASGRARASDRREASILRMFIGAEITFLGIELGAKYRLLEHCREEWVRDAIWRGHFHDEILTFSTPSIDRVFNRIHVLSDKNANDVAGFLGGLSALKELDRNAMMTWRGEDEREKFYDLIKKALGELWHNSVALQASLLDESITTLGEKRDQSTFSK